MNTLIDFLNLPVYPLFDQANQFLTSLPDFGLLSGTGSGLTLAFALGATGTGGSNSIPEGVLAGARRWHGGIDDRFAAIDNAVGLIEAHQQTWAMPTELLTLLTGNRSRLQEMINRCRTPLASSADRAMRNTLLASTVGLCLRNVRMWAYGQFFAGILTAEDLHLLGFLLPGELSRHRDRAEATDVLAETKVTVINEDFIRVVIDRSSGENAAQVAHGWPDGVHMALTVIISVESGKEVFRQITTRLHNDIPMPEGSHGEQFILKAAFLRHVDDEPRFGNEPTFTMPPPSTVSITKISTPGLQEIERHRQKIERLQAKTNSK
jgi:hypothetical protein